MKKILLSAVVALFAVSALQAKVTLQAGSADFINEANATAVLSFDFNDCVVVSFQAGKVNKDFGTLDEYIESKQLDKEKTIPQSALFDYARGQFNKANKKGLKLLASEESIKSYKTSKNPPADMDAKQQKKLAKSIKMLGKFGYVWDESNIKYDIIVHVDTLSAGSFSPAQAGSLIGMIPGADGGSAMIGWAEVIDRASHDVVCELHIGKFYGTGAANFPQRVANVLAACIIKELPDAKKLVAKKK